MQSQVHTTPNDSDQSSSMDTIVCDPNERWQQRVSLVPITELTNGDGGNNTNLLAYTNRKRKTNNPQPIAKRIKTVVNEKSLTLNEKISSEDVTINVSFPKFQKFDSEDYEDSEPTTLMETKSGEDSVKAIVDNDCIITGEPLDTVIDLSEDDSEENGSGKMIELILCNEIEPEPSESSEMAVELFSNCDDDQYTRSQSLRVHCDTLRNNDDSPVGNDHIDPIDIDLTAEKNDEDVACEDIIQNQTTDLVHQQIVDDTSNVDVERNRITVKEKMKQKLDGILSQSTHLADEPTFDDETNVDVEKYRASIIEKVKRKLRTQYPQVVQSVSWNDKSKQFEVSISKKSGFKADDKFQEFLRDTVTEAVQQNSISMNRKTKHSITKEVHSNQINRKNILNKDYSPKHQEISNSLVGEEDNGKKSSSPNAVTNSTTESTSSTKESITESTRNKPIVIDHKLNQILKNAVFYLGVSEKTFHKMESLLPASYRNRRNLVLLLRKLKLNEPFEILREMLCPQLNLDVCINTFTNCVEEASRRLKSVIQSNYRREPLAIVDILEIEIKKPASLIQQRISFCCERQRYLVKFIISFTAAGHITYLSPPTHILNSKMLSPCLSRIPKTFTVVANPYLFKFCATRRMTSLFQSDRQAERTVSQLVFDRMRRFSRINSVEELINVRLLQHTVTLVACLCNLQKE